MIATQQDFSQVLNSLGKRNWTAEEKSFIKSDPFLRARIIFFLEDCYIDWNNANKQFAIELQNELPLQILEDFIQQEFPKQSSYTPPSEDDPIPF